MASEPGMYVWREAGETVLIIHTHVDDVLAAVKLGSQGEIVLDQIAEQVSAQETMTTIGQKAHRHLGRELSRDEKYVYVRQKRVFVVEDLEIEYDPLQPRDLNEKEISVFRSYVGQLLWFSRCTSPELFYVTNKLARALSGPITEHFQLARKVIDKVQGTTAEIRFSKYKGVLGPVPPTDLTY